MEKNYDVAIISGLMVAYGLLQKNKDLKILICEKGKDIGRRFCPILNNPDEKCKKCKQCSIMSGLAGAGAFSDGKFIISKEYGGHLQDYIGVDKALMYMKDLDEILMKFGATSEIYKPNDKLCELCKKNKLQIKEGIIKHLGTENNIIIMGKLIQYLKKYCTIKENCEVTDVNPHEYKVHFKNLSEYITSKYIVFAIGRSGTTFFTNWCKKYGISRYNNYVDIGVRVELKAEIWNDISTITYDPKISYTNELYNDVTRMFCFNKNGHVVVENTFGARTVNGHAYKNKERFSENSNFALLTSIKFDNQFNSSTEYVNLIAKTVNCIAGDNVIVQRFGDLRKGRRTTEDRLMKSSIQPTLKSAYPGDLSLCIPKRQLDNIIDMILRLDTIAPGTAADDTLLYGVEGKYYSEIAKMNNFKIGEFERVYGCGDGCGITRSLAQAGANGLYIADLIYKCTQSEI